MFTLCCTPVEVTVTAMVYVPAGVAFAAAPPPEPPPGPPPEPPPELAQLEAAPIRIARIAAFHRALRRFDHPNGNNMSAHSTGTAPHPGPLELATVADWPVEISTVTFPVTPALSVSVVGLNAQTAFAGRVPHCSVKVPRDPFIGVMETV